MPHYEIVLLLNPDRSDQISSMLERYKSMLQSDSGILHRFEDWGRKQLAYRIDDYFKAHYLLFNIECSIEQLKSLVEAFVFNDAIIRYLVLSKDKAYTGISPMQQQRIDANQLHDQIAATSASQQDKMSIGAGAQLQDKDKLDQIVCFDLDYKNLEFLLQNVSDAKKILSSRLTNRTAKDQRRLSKAIKIARYLALMPYTDKQEF